MINLIFRWWKINEWMLVAPAHSTNKCSVQYFSCVRTSTSRAVCLVRWRRTCCVEWRKQVNKAITRALINNPNHNKAWTEAVSSVHACSAIRCFIIRYLLQDPLWPKYLMRLIILNTDTTKQHICIRTRRVLAIKAMLLSIELPVIVLGLNQSSIAFDEVHLIRPNWAWIDLDPLMLNISYVIEPK